MKRQRSARCARELLEHEHLSEQVVEFVPAAVDNAEALEVKVHERLDHFVRQTAITPPLGDGRFVEIPLAKLTHFGNERTLVVAQTKIHTSPLSSDIRSTGQDAATFR